jgi:hypothetical protein
MAETERCRLHYQQQDCHNKLFCVLLSSSATILKFLKPYFTLDSYFYSEQRNTNKMCVRYVHSTTLLRPVTFYYLVSIQRAILKTVFRKSYLFDTVKNYLLKLQRVFNINYHENVYLKICGCYTCIKAILWRFFVSFSLLDYKMP